MENLNDDFRKVVQELATEEGISFSEAIDAAINTLKQEVQRRKSFKLSEPGGQGEGFSGGWIEKGRPVTK